MSGVELLLLHREVAYRSCDHCKEWMYNHETGELDLRFRGKPCKRVGGPPCQGHEKVTEEVARSRCAKVSPEAGLDLSPIGWSIYNHYLECHATSSFPADPHVRRHAAIIRQVTDSCERVLLARLILGSQVRIIDGDRT